MNCKLPECRFWHDRGLMLCYIHTHTPPVLLNHCHLHSSVTLLGEQSLNLVSDVSWSWSALVDCQATSAAVPSIGLWTLDGSALFPHGVLSPIATLVSLLVTQTLQLLASVCNLGQRSLFVCLNDKHRLKVGEPGYPLRSTKRGRRVMVSKGTVF